MHLDLNVLAGEKGPTGHLLCASAEQTRNKRMKRPGVRQRGMLGTGGDRRERIPSAGDSSC